MLDPLQNPPNLCGLSRDDLATRLGALGEPPYRADQILTWVYRKHERTPLRMTNLPSSLRERLPSLLGLERARHSTVHSTRDGQTHKFVLELNGGARVECVSMRSDDRLTF